MQRRPVQRKAREEIVEIPLSVAAQISMRQVGQDFLSHRTDIGDFVAREGKAAGHAADRGCGRRIKYLSQQNWLPSAGIGLPRRWAQEGGKVPAAFRIRGHSRDVPCSSIIAILLPGEKEESLIVAVVNMRNVDRAT